mgnify:CR=1 FL=1
MPAKSGAFHSTGYLVSVVVSGLLIEYVMAYVPSFRAISRFAGNLLSTYLDVPLHEEVAGMMVVTGLLLAVWGAAYHVHRH